MTALNLSRITITTAALLLLAVYISPALARDVRNPAVLDAYAVDTVALYGAAAEAYDAGDYELAAEHYLALLDYSATDMGALYNLACCYGLLGEATLAANTVRLLAAAGYTEFWQINEDPDFDPVRDNGDFQLALQSAVTDLESERELWGEITFTPMEMLQPCRVRLPEGYDPERSYPLVIGLHGFGSFPERFVRLMDKVAVVDFIYVSPQAPYGFYNGEETGFSWMGGTDRTALPPEAMAQAVAYVAHVAAHLEDKYDVSATYLLGFSQGAGLSLMAGISNPELYAGVVACGGWLDEEFLAAEQIAAASSLPVLIVHGASDQVVPYDSAENALSVLEASGYEVTLHTFDGGHRIPLDTREAIHTWLKEHFPR